MDLLSGQPYWFYKNGAINAYSSLLDNETADIVVMGGGITGALISWYLTQAGYQVVVLEKRHIGLGSTSGSTALLQYEIDEMLIDLIKMIGREDAVRSYQLCISAINQVEQIVSKLRKNVGFSRRKSIYYSSRQKDLADLKKEFQERKQNGIKVDWWERSDLEEHFPNLNKAGAILSHDGAQIDAYQFTHALFQDCLTNGAKVLDTVEVVDIQTGRNGVTLITEQGKSVRAKKLIIAAGYESQDYLKKNVIRLHSSYAIVSKPIRQPEDLWYKNALLWESARPYLYLRTTEDQRIMIGGKDETFQSPGKRDRLMNRKGKQLEGAVRKLFPELPFVTDYQWCGTFAETKDGLPLIGSVKEYLNTYFAMGCGGNGILFSVIAAEIITDLIAGKKNNDAKIFGFDRF